MSAIFRSEFHFHLFVIAFYPVVYGSPQVHRVISDKDVQYLFQFIFVDALHLKIQFANITRLLDGKHQPLFGL